MKEKLFNRGFALCTMCSFFCTVTFFLFFTGISSYSQSVLGTDAAVAGLVVSSFIVGDLIARVVHGWNMNVIGKHNLATFTLLLGVPCAALYFCVHSLIPFILIRIFQGFCYGAASSCVSTMVAEQLPESRRSEGLGYFLLSVTLGSIAGPFLCMWIQNHVSFDAVFALGLAMQICALLCMLPFKARFKKFTPVEKKALFDFKLSHIYEKSALPLSIVCFVFFFAYSGVLTFVSPYGDVIGLPDEASVFFVFVSIATLISRAFLCKIDDIKGDNVAIIPFFILFIIGMYVLSRADSGYMLFAAGLLMGFNVAQYIAVGEAASIRHIPAERYGVAICTFNIFLDLSYAIGPSVYGLVIGGYGYRDAFLIMDGVAVLALILYLVLHGIPEHRRRTSSD